MAQTTATATLNEEVDELIAQGNKPRSILTSKMMGAVEGYAYRKTRKADGSLAELSAEEKTSKAFTAEKALRAAVKQGIENPQDVLKGLNPQFAQALAPVLSRSNDPLLQAMVSAVNEIGAELGKNFTLSSPISTGLVPFDLEQPSHLTYWFDTPLRAKIAREQGEGTSHRTKVVTGVSGSLTGPSGGKVVDPFIAEQTNFGTWPGSLPAAGVQDGEDVNIGYKFLGMSESLSWLAQYAGRGFEDATALANLILMQEMHFAEEYAIVAGTQTALTAPAAVSASARTAGSGETAISNGDGTHNFVSVSIVNYYGETVATASADVGAIANTQVVDVVITPPAGNPGQQFSVYFQKGGTPYARASAFFVATTGGTKFTLQGAMPTSGNNPKAADSGTSNALRWEGLLSILSGHTASANGYPADFQAGYANLAVQNILSLSVLNNAMQKSYNGKATDAGVNPSGAYRASCEELLVGGQDATVLSNDVATNAGSTNYQLRIDQSDVTGVTYGNAVSQIVNPITRKLMAITVHPALPQGQAIGTQWTTPQSARNSNVWEMRLVQDLFSVAWPVIDPTYRFSMFEYGTFFGQAPQFAFLLSGLQLNAANPWS